MVFVMQVIIAEGEEKASQALRQAAEVIGGSPAALQVGTVDAFYFLTESSALLALLACSICPHLTCYS